VAQHAGQVMQADASDQVMKILAKPLESANSNKTYVLRPRMFTNNGEFSAGDWIARAVVCSSLTTRGFR